MDHRKTPKIKMRIVNGIELDDGVDEPSDREELEDGACEYCGARRLDSGCYTSAPCIECYDVAPRDLTIIPHNVKEHAPPLLESESVETEKLDGGCRASACSALMVFGQAGPLGRDSLVILGIVAVAVLTVGIASWLADRRGAKLDQCITKSQSKRE